MCNICVRMNWNPRNMKLSVPSMGSIHSQENFPTSQIVPRSCGPGISSAAKEQVKSEQLRVKVTSRTHTWILHNVLSTPENTFAMEHQRNREHATESYQHTYPVRKLCKPCLLVIHFIYYFNLPPRCLPVTHVNPHDLSNQSLSSSTMLPENSQCEHCFIVALTKLPWHVEDLFCIWEHLHNGAISDRLHIAIKARQLRRPQFAVRAWELRC